MRVEEREALRERRLATIRRMWAAGEDVRAIKDALQPIDKKTWQALRVEVEAEGKAVAR